MKKVNSNDPNKLDDSFGNVWFKCELGADCGLEIVRPGKTQCWCDSIEILCDRFDHNDLERSGWAGEGWYFWSMDKNTCYGPHSDEAHAKREFLKYLKTLDNEHPNN